MKLSKKMVVAILVPVIDVLVALSAIPMELKPLLISMITALGGVYEIGQSTVDAVKESRKK